MNWKRILYSCAVAGLLHSGCSQSSRPADRGAVLDAISSNEIMHTVDALESFETRFMLAENRFAVADWIAAQFETFGFENIERDTVFCKTHVFPPFLYRDVDTTTVQINVVVTLEGKMRPEDVLIVCAHYDAYTDHGNPFHAAPGADDNGSGVAAIMAMAKAMKACDYQPECTLRFIAFAAEELIPFGDGGSTLYANKMREEGARIRGVVSVDMVGFNSHSPDSLACSLCHPEGMNVDELVEVIEGATTLSVIRETYVGGDLKSFVNQGYSGIQFEERDFAGNINWHKAGDVSAIIDPSYLAQMTRAVCAVLLAMDGVGGIPIGQTAR